MQCRDRGRLVLLVSTAANISFLLGCGGDSGNGGGGMVAPTPVPQPAVVAQGVLPVSGINTVLMPGGDPCGFVQFVPFSIDSTGRIDATIEWASAANDLDIAITRGNCSCDIFLQSATVEELNAACPTVVESTSVTAKPETVSASAQAAGRYTMIVANFGDTDDQFSYQVVHTPGS